MANLGQIEKKVALFGGTFDPVHSGLLEVAERACETLGLDQVVFLPCRQSPHKEAAAGASEQDRLEMLKLATAGMKWAVVSDWEFHQPMPSYSWRTAESFQEEMPNARLFWLMGWDQWEVLPSWDRFSYFCQLVEFIVHARHGRDGAAISHEGARVSLVSGDHPASSSEIRELCSLKAKIPSLWVPQKVEEYIEVRRLYAK